HCKVDLSVTVLGKPVLEPGMSHQIRVEHLQYRIDVFFGTNVLESREIQHYLIWSLCLPQKSLHDRTSIVDRQCAELDVPQAKPCASKITNQLYEIVLILINDMDYAGRVVDQQTGGGGTDRSAAANDQHASSSQLSQNIGGERVQIAPKERLLAPSD